MGDRPENNLRVTGASSFIIIIIIITIIIIIIIKERQFEFRKFGSQQCMIQPAYEIMFTSCII